MPAVEVSAQVLAFVQALAPEPRRRLRLAIRGLANDRGDLRDLDGPLQGCSRLRVGPYRVLLARGASPGGRPTVFCVFAERRNVVYAVFSDMLRRRLLSDA